MKKILFLFLSSSFLIIVNLWWCPFSSCYYYNWQHPQQKILPIVNLTTAHAQPVIFYTTTKTLQRPAQQAATIWNRRLGRTIFQKRAQGATLRITTGPAAAKINGQTRMGGTAIMLNRKVPQSCQKSVLIHELGPALGVGHSSRDTDLMYPYDRWGQTLSDQDVQVARHSLSFYSPRLMRYYFPVFQQQQLWTQKALGFLRFSL